MADSWQGEWWKIGKVYADDMQTPKGYTVIMLHSNSAKNAAFEAYGFESGVLLRPVFSRDSPCV